VRRIHPGPPTALTDDALRASYAYPDATAWVRANMVSSLDGAIRGADGQAKSITTKADQRVFTLARLACDVILVGAGTVRAEDYRPSKRTLAIVSTRLDLPLTLRMFADRTDANPRPIVLTTDEAAADAPADLRAAADVVACGTGHVDLHRAIQVLVDRGLTRILCEGGPSLLSDMVAADLVDELLLTLSPMLVGATSAEHITQVAGGLVPPRRLELLEVLEDEGTTFLRLRVLPC
jgi:riboflavin-specific deaminase-like protein